MEMIILSVAIIYIIMLYVIGYWSYRKSLRLPNFLLEYFTASRELGALMLALTTATAYLSAGSFIGGPGTAFRLGLGWVLLAMTQLPTMWLVLGVIGKKIAIVARRIKAITLVDILRERYENNVLVVFMSSIAIVVFMIAAITAQAIGGATIYETLTGLRYDVSLTIFFITVVVYTVIGGYRAVAYTDLLQGAVMTIGAIALVTYPIISAGGLENIMRKLIEININYVTPYGATGGLNPLWVTSFFVLVGIGVIGLPYVSVKALTYRDSKSLHNGILIGTIVSALMLLCMHLAGVIAAYYVPEITRGDLAIPALTVKAVPPVLAGIILAAPLSAILTTVDSQLILVSSAVVKDIYVNLVNPKASEKTLRRLSFLTTLIIGIIALLLSYRPPDLLVWLNLYAIGGLESVFLVPLTLGLFWSRGNKYGALSSMLVGLVSFIAFYRVFGTNMYNLHPVVYSITLSLITYIIVSMITRKPSEEVIKKFF
ncbi:MAG: sodium/pantothenate symporter [Zestosphaera sp.]